MGAPGKGERYSAELFLFSADSPRVYHPSAASQYQTVP
jgi:hypothetical protein